MFTYTSITVQRLETKMLPICSFQLLHELSTLFTCKVLLLLQVLVLVSTA